MCIYIAGFAWSWGLRFLCILCRGDEHLHQQVLLPETKGVPIEEMTIVWKNHPNWSKYVSDEDPNYKMAKKAGSV
ncbi:hypothetical protein CRYUN_Cryun07bG0159000 [Craigia yunnanensis]